MYNSALPQHSENRMSLAAFSILFRTLATAQQETSKEAKGHQQHYAEEDNPASLGYVPGGRQIFVPVFYHYNKVYCLSIFVQQTKVQCSALISKKTNKS
jgi:uncharacterized membrane protein